MDYCYDPDFDFLLDALSREEVTSFEDFTLASSSSDSSATYQNCRLKKTKKKCDPSFTDDSSIESDLPLAKPRILRTDIRRSYATMFLNVFNTCDLPLMFGFFDTFFTPTMNSEFSRPDCIQNKRLVVKQASNLDAIRFWWTHFACLKADAVLTMKDCRIITPLNSSESRIVFTTNFKATILFEEKNLPKELTNKEGDYQLFADASKTTDEEAEKLTGSKRTLKNEMTEKTKEMKYIMSSTENMLSRLSLREKPFYIDALGVVTLDLDEDKRIKRLVMSCTPKM